MKQVSRIVFILVCFAFNFESGFSQAFRQSPVINLLPYEVVLCNITLPDSIVYVFTSNKKINGSTNVKQKIHEFIFTPGLSIQAENEIEIPHFDGRKVEILSICRLGSSLVYTGRVFYGGTDELVFGKFNLVTKKFDKPVIGPDFETFAANYAAVTTFTFGVSTSNVFGFVVINYMAQSENATGGGIANLHAIVRFGSDLKSSLGFTIDESQGEFIPSPVKYSVDDFGTLYCICRMNDRTEKELTEENMFPRVDLFRSYPDSKIVMKERIRGTGDTTYFPKSVRQFGKKVYMMGIALYSDKKKNDISDYHYVPFIKEIIANKEIGRLTEFDKLNLPIQDGIDYESSILSTVDPVLNGFLLAFEYQTCGYNDGLKCKSQYAIVVHLDTVEKKSTVVLLQQTNVVKGKHFADYFMDYPSYPGGASSFVSGKTNGNHILLCTSNNNKSGIFSSLDDVNFLNEGIASVTMETSIFPYSCNTDSVMNILLIDGDKLWLIGPKF